MSARPEHANPTRPEKTPASIRSHLIPEERPEFEAAYQAAMRLATDTFDLTPVHDCIDMWFGHAVLAFGDHEGYRAAMEDARKLLAGEYVETIPWEQVATELGLKG